MIVSLRISKYSRVTLLFFSSACVFHGTTNNCDRERNAREVLDVVPGVAGG